MAPFETPLLIEPETLAAQLGSAGLMVVDLSRRDVHQQLHIPGAQLLDYGEIVAARPPTGGLLPDAERLGRVLGAMGVDPQTYIVAYDDEGGGKAARLLWTLEAIGHRRASLLNGGLHAWANEGHPLSRDKSPAAAPVEYPVALAARPAPVADTEYILTRLGAPDLALLDARSPDEFSGERLFAARGGHIPGAINFEWTEAMDRSRNLRLRPPAELSSELLERGVTPDKEVVVYCQTHHRSALSYVMLKALGYPRVRGYPGSWSEWGNRRDTPVER